MRRQFYPSGREMAGETHTVSRGTPEPDLKATMKYKYTGGIFRNGFKVIGGAIDLLSVGFYGPCKAESAEYFVTVNVTSPLWVDQPFPECFWPLGPIVKLLGRASRSQQRRCIIKEYGRFRGSVTAQKGQIFHVKFIEPIRIPDETWITIEFELKGSNNNPTQRLKEIKGSFCHHEVETIKGRRTLIFLAGSHQMPEVSFQPA